MHIIIGSLTGLAISSVALLYFYFERKEHTRFVKVIIDDHSKEKEEWFKERQQLLDRIQAPSFSEFKHAEVKTIKAQQGIKEPQPLEPL